MAIGDVFDALKTGIEGLTPVTGGATRTFQVLEVRGVAPESFEELPAPTQDRGVILVLTEGDESTTFAGTNTVSTWSLDIIIGHDTAKRDTLAHCKVVAEDEQLITEYLHVDAPGRAYGVANWLHTGTARSLSDRMQVSTLSYEAEIKLPWLISR